MWQLYFNYYRFKSALKNISFVILKILYEKKLTYKNFIWFSFLFYLFSFSPTPNGDSSSTTSRQSPAKVLYRSNKGKMALVVGTDILIPEVLGKVIVGKVKGIVCLL